MSSGKTLIRGGSCVLPEGTLKKDLLISGEKIEAVPDERSDASFPEAENIIDAENRIIMPGGIDPHVHFNLPLSGGIHSADDFRSGSLAAISGGTTTIIDFITPIPGQTLDEASERRLKEAEACLCDYSLHFSIVSGMKDIKKQLKECSSRYGIKSCKIYLAYQKTIGLNDAEAFEVFQAASELGIKLLVHCEWGEAIDYMRSDFADKGNKKTVYHALSRPAWAEQAAVAKACRMAEICGTELYIVHVSTAEGIGEIMKARQRGVKINAEVCLHHLLLDDRMYSEDESRAPLFVMSPPLRASGQKAALWQFAKAGIVNNVSTDHCPFMKAEKLEPDNFGSVPNGVNGVEERVPLFLSEAINRHGFSLAEASAMLSGNAAGFFSLNGKSGKIEVGSDADLIIIDPKGVTEITAEYHHSKSDYNCYERLSAGLKIEKVILRGKTAAADGKPFGNIGKGRFLS